MAISDEYLKDLEKQDQQRKAESLANVYSNNVKPVTTYDFLWQLHAGYLIDNKTYLDPQGTQRLPVGLYFHSQQGLFNDRQRRSSILTILSRYRRRPPHLQTQTLAKAICHACTTLRHRHRKPPWNQPYQQNLNTLQAQRGTDTATV